MSNWKQAKKDLQNAGIAVNTSLKGCCLGCVENSPIPDGVPALYQLRSRWSKQGGMLCHSKIGDTLTALTVMRILTANGVEWRWDGSQARAIEITITEEA